MLNEEGVGEVASEVVARHLLGVEVARTVSCIGGGIRDGALDRPRRERDEGFIVAASKSLGEFLRTETGPPTRGPFGTPPDHDYVH